MRIAGLMMAGALAMLAGAAAALSLPTDAEAWRLATVAQVNQTDWRMLHRDQNLAVFLRSEPERPGQYWMAVVRVRHEEVEKTLQAISCPSRTMQEVRGMTFKLDGRVVRQRSDMPAMAPALNSANEVVMRHVCASQAFGPAATPGAAATSMVPATPPPPDMEVIDSYRASGKRLVMFVGEPVVVRVWAHPSDAHVWRLEPSDGVEQVGTPRLYTAPPSGGAGFNQAYDVVIRAKRTGIFQVAIVNVHKQTGARNDWASPPVRFEVRGVRDGGATPSN